MIGTTSTMPWTTVTTLISDVLLHSAIWHCEAKIYFYAILRDLYFFSIYGNPIRERSVKRFSKASEKRRLRKSKTSHRKMPEL